MKAIIATAALSGLIHGTFAWDSPVVLNRLVVDGKDTGPWKHVLDIDPQPRWEGDGGTNSREYHKGFPILEGPPWDSEWATVNITCGRRAFHSLPKTEVADVVAGSELAFRSATAKDFGPRYENYTEYYSKMHFHGPAQVYLSRAYEDDIKNYRGEGKWFKITEIKAKNRTDWALYGETDLKFKIPETVPPGKYIVRAELWEPATTPGSTQWWVSCALLDIKGSGKTPIDPENYVVMARFPGTYVLDDRDKQGKVVPENQMKNWVPDSELRLDEYYGVPGPPLYRSG